MIPEPGVESLAVLLLPSKLEDFEFAAHPRSLLEIPRVVALEPSRVRTPRLLRDAAPLRQARKLRFPGRPRLIVLYHPAQYPLARALVGRHEVELWYIPPELESLKAAGGPEVADWLEFDGLARDLAAQTLPVLDDDRVPDEPLRVRLRELDVINARAFIPEGRSPRR